MALPDLTGQNIQDTYKRVLTVGDNGLMYDGTGSLFTPLSASHEITTEVSSSHAVNADTASFAVNFTASGNISGSATTTISGQDLRLDRDLVVGNNISSSEHISGSVISASVGFHTHGNVTVENTLTATTINTLFRGSDKRYASLIVVGRDSGARVQIPITITQQN